jgi:hypothetical protein
MIVLHLVLFLRAQTGLARNRTLARSSTVPKRLISFKSGKTGVSDRKAPFSMLSGGIPAQVFGREESGE